MNKNIEIFLNEEFGYRTFTWKPGMTEPEFIEWWNSLTDSDIIKYYFNINSLPGTISEVRANKMGDARIRVHGDPRNQTPHYYCHFHDVDDTFIEIGESRIPYRRTSRRDWKENWLDFQIKNKKPEEIA
jgi:hypothetical protein